MKTLTSIYVHVITSTRHREPAIPEELDGPLHGYIDEILQRRGSRAVASGGSDDHRHVLMKLGLEDSLSAAIRRFKSSASGWLKNKCPSWPGWQAGYAAFTVSPEDVPNLCRYIGRQREHHRSKAFGDEWDQMTQESSAA